MPQTSPDPAAPPELPLPLVGQSYSAGARAGWVRVRSGSSSVHMPLDREGPTAWGVATAPDPDASESDRDFSHRVRAGSALGSAQAVHAAAQRLLWEGVVAHNPSVVRGALAAGADPHEPSWAFTETEDPPFASDTPLAWLFACQSTEPSATHRLPFHREIFDLMWAAGGRTDPRPGDSASSIATGWVHLAQVLPPEDMRHVGTALLQGGCLDRPGGDGRAPLDVALEQGVTPVLDFLAAHGPLERWVNKSVHYGAPTPSLVFALFGRRHLRWATEPAPDQAMTAPRRAARIAYERITQVWWPVLFRTCSWEQWRTLSAARSCPIAVALETLRPAEAVALLRTVPKFSWDDRLRITAPTGRDLSQWRRRLLRIRRNWIREGTWTDQRRELFARHPALQRFAPLLAINARQYVRAVVLSHHPGATVDAPAAQRAAYERAILRIAEIEQRRAAQLAVHEGRPRRVL